MMSIVFNFPAFTILLSLLCAGIGFAIKNRKAAKALCLSLLSVCLVMNISSLFFCMDHGRYYYQMGHYPAPWGNCLAIGICECLVAALFCLVLMLCVIGGGKEIDADIEGSKHYLYYVMISLVNASLAALVYTNDVFTAYVFIEICTIASTGLLMSRGTGRSILASTRYMIFSLLGSGLFLIGIILLYSITGHLLMPDILEQVDTLWSSDQYRTPLLIVIGLVSIGLAIKSGLFPFHSWMPDTYGCATAASSGMLSGVISKGYIFLLIKLIYHCFGADIFFQTGVNNALFVFGICGMIIGSLRAIREKEINRMTAFSSAAQIGYIFMGIGLGPAMGMVAAMFHLLSHAITKPLIFLANAQLCEVSGGSGRFDDLRGAGLRNKMAGFAFTVGALSMVGIPGFMGFASKLMFAQAAVGSHLKLVLTFAALAISTILNTVYFLHTMITIYLTGSGKHGDMPPVAIRSQPWFTVTAFCFIAINLIIGLHARPIIAVIEQGLL